MDELRDLNAIQLAVAETKRARELHNRSIETRTNDGRLRILVEEVGEVARAIEDLEEATDKDVCASLQHLTSELVQTASAALRWVAALNDQEVVKPPSRMSSYRFITDRALKVRPDPGPCMMLGATVTGLSYDELVVVCTREDLIESAFNDQLWSLRTRRHSTSSKFSLEIV